VPNVILCFVYVHMGYVRYFFAPRCAIDGAVMAPEAVSKVPGNH